MVKKINLFSDVKRKSSIKKNLYKITDKKYIELTYSKPEPKKFKENLKSSDSNLNEKTQSDYVNNLKKFQNMDFKIRSDFDLNKDVKSIIPNNNNYLKSKNIIDSINSSRLYFNENQQNLIKMEYVKYKNLDFDSEIEHRLSHNLKNFDNLTIDKFFSHNTLSHIQNFNSNIKKDKILINNAVLSEIDSISGKVKTNENNKSKTTQSLALVTKDTFEKKQSNLTGSLSVISYDKQIEISSNKKIGEYEKYRSKEIRNPVIDLTISKKNSNLSNDIKYKYLSEDFLNEDSLNEKCKKVKNKITLKIKPEEKLRYDIKVEVKKINTYDEKLDMKKFIVWSGQDVLNFNDNEENFPEYNLLISKLENFDDVNLFSTNTILSKLQKIRSILHKLSISSPLDITIIFVVIINAFFMAIDGNLLRPEQLESVNFTKYVFNAIYIAEFLVKIIGLGPLLYFSEVFNYLDITIIISAIVEMGTEISGGNSKNIEKLTFLRVFRIFRVLRLMKILKKFKSIRKILTGISKALSSVSYIVLILLIFIVIFQLLGMTILNFDEAYQSFLNSFYETFQLLTLENWNNIALRLYKKSGFTILYLIIWICFGNFVIFNLFLSILLDSFNSEEEKEIEFPINYPEVFKFYELRDIEHINKKKIKKSKDFKKNLEHETENLDNSDDENESYSDDEEEENISSKNTTSILINRNNQRRYSGKKLQGLNKINTNKSNRSTETINLATYKNSEVLTSETNPLFNDNQGKVYKQFKKELSIRSHGSFKKSKTPFSSATNLKLNSEKNENFKTNRFYDHNVELLFKKNQCEKSLYFLSQKNKFRIFLFKVTNHRIFDRVILFIIFFSTFRLIVETFIRQNGSAFSSISAIVFDVLDTLFNLIFLFECLMKILSLGFIIDKGSYLRDSWNKLDFLIVLVSLFDFQSLIQKYFTDTAYNNDIGFLKVLRMLRILRPLRFISHNVQLKLLINSILDSIKSIINVLIIVIVVFLMISIVGINLFSSLFFTCYDTLKNPEFEQFSNSTLSIKSDSTEYLNTCYELQGNFDSLPLFKYSNIVDGMILSYILASMEGWPDIMHDYIKYGKIYGLFFIANILITSYFFMNLFVGVMFSSFNDAITKESKAGIINNTKAQKYLDYIYQLDTAKPEYIIFKEIKLAEWRKYPKAIITYPQFDNIIMFFIVLNLIIMAIAYDDSSEVYNSISSIMNYIFSAIFTIECILKLLGIGYNRYIYDSWNRFDLFVVCTSLLDITISNSTGSRASFLKSFQILRVLRVLRVTRVLRLVKSLKGLEKLLQTLKWSLQALGNVLILLLLVFFIFSILGSYIFFIYYIDYKDKFRFYNEYFNFDNFIKSFLLVFRSATGENWHIVMIELANVDKSKINPAVAIIFSIVMNFFTFYIMMNLFLLITLQQYSEFFSKSENPIEIFNNIVDSFKFAWNYKSTHINKGLRIKDSMLLEVFSMMKIDFLKKYQFSRESLQKYILDLKILR